jgi:hypothetical protein
MSSVISDTVVYEKNGSDVRVGGRGFCAEMSTPYIISGEGQPKFKSILYDTPYVNSMANHITILDGLLNIPKKSFSRTISLAIYTVFEAATNIFPTINFRILLILDNWSVPISTTTHKLTEVVSKSSIHVITLIPPGATLQFLIGSASVETQIKTQKIYGQFF